MDHRIGRMHQSYRLLGVEGPAPAVASRLDRVTAACLPAAIDRALGAALGDDPAVRVLRRVHARYAIRLDAAESDEALADAWGGRVAASIVRAIAEGAGRGEIARFDDRADYASSFAVDLLAGLAWDRWYYAAFAPLRPLAVPEALAAVLADHRDVLPDLLARLRRADRLDAVLALLPLAASRALWDGLRGLAPGRAGAAEAARPLFVLAARLLERLGLRRPPPDGLASLWPAYRDSDPPEVDWRDRDALAACVIEALRFLLARLPSTEVDAPIGPDPIREALRDLGADWLEPEAVARGLARLLDPRGPASTRRGPTPMQARLLDEIRRAIADVLGSLVADPIDAPANAIRIVAALVARHPSRAGDPAAMAMIAALLAAATDIAREWLRRGDARDRALAALGPEGIDLAEALAERSARPRVGPREDGVATRCAGLFFLIRPILDIRLSAIHRAASDGGDLPEFSALLAALALRWAGPSCEPDDPGLALFAGSEDGTPIAADWSSTDPAALGRFQSALLRQLVGLRMLDPEAMGVHADPDADGRIRLVAGDASAGLWPLGRIVGGSDIPGVLSEWADLVEEASGVRPRWDRIDEPPESWTAATEALGRRACDRPDVELTLTLAAIAVVRGWGRWLGRFAGSSTPYLLASFLRRPGLVRAGRGGIEVEYEPRPLDVVLGLAGYGATIEAVPWLGGRRVGFRPIAV